MTATELAKAWGKSKQYVSKLRKQGLPLDSLEAADAWVAERKQRAPQPSRIVVPREIRPPEVPAPLDGELARDDLIGTLARARQTEIESYRILADAIAGHDSARVQLLVRGHREATRARVEAEREIARMQRESAQTVTMDEARELITRHLMRLRSLLDAMPSSLCHRCNPTDPGLAKAAITEAVNQLLNAMVKTDEELRAKES